MLVSPTSPAEPLASSPPDAATGQLADLLALEARVQGVVERVSPAVVSVRIQGGSGSGVVIGNEGYVLTAAHVSGKPGRPCIITFPNGTRVNGVSLGRHPANDSGLLRITDSGRFPHAELGPADLPEIGQWTLALGHPQGFQPQRPIVARLGQVIAARPATLQTDCTLIGGDSGGPLFDLEGRVIGIHSRIGGPTGHNFHAPVGVFLARWDDLTASREVAPGFLGVSGDNHAKGAKIDHVFPDTAAAAAGLQPGDIITHIDGQRIRSFRELAALISERGAGDRLDLTALRKTKRLTRALTLNPRPEPAAPPEP
ncbi:MAG: trypsin-like peptidase domain-containing protein [Planctomycetota bacterium]